MSGFMQGASYLGIADESCDGKGARIEEHVKFGEHYYGRRRKSGRERATIADMVREVQGTEHDL
jgi:hypothetical protein